VTVQVRDGRALISSGGFAETNEHIAGYCLIDGKDLDEAGGIASQMWAAGPLTFTEHLLRNVALGERLPKPHTAAVKAQMAAAVPGSMPWSRVVPRGVPLD
jgi:hypothetical protein